MSIGGSHGRGQASCLPTPAAESAPFGRPLGVPLRAEAFSSTEGPSRTAVRTGFFRALETAKVTRDTTFSRPLAASFWPSLKLALRMASLPVVGKGIPKFIDYRWPGARTSGIARTRLIDDLITEAFADGLEQVVILGAGF